MSTSQDSTEKASGPNSFGYNDFVLGNFKFNRDEYLK